MDSIQSNGLRHRCFFWSWAETQHSSHVGGVVARVKRVFVGMISNQLVRIDTSGGFKIVIEWNYCLVMVEDMSMPSSSRTCTTTVTASFATTSSTATTTTAAPERRPKYFPKQFECFYFLRRAN